MVRRGTRGIADVMTQIKKMLLEKSSNDSVMEYISVSSQMTPKPPQTNQKIQIFQSTESSKDPNFIRQLTTVVMECCCDEYLQSGSPLTYKLNNVKLEPLSQLLHKYIDNNIERELQCVYALQNFAFVREYPPGEKSFWGFLNKNWGFWIFLVNF